MLFCGPQRKRFVRYCIPTKFHRHFSFNAFDSEVMAD